MSVTVKAVSHIGNFRKVNEDRYIVRNLTDGSLLIAVADGMGGVPGGDRASSLAIGAFEAADDTVDMGEEMLCRMVMAAHRAVLTYVNKNPHMDGMGTTLTAATIRDGIVVWAHVGDSRLYLFHNDELQQLTTDHRFITSMIKDGDISAEEASNHPLRNILDQCLGCSTIEPEVGNIGIQADDILLLCSDGLYEDVSDTSIVTILKQDTALETKASLLLQIALNNAGKDNITLVLVESNPVGNS